MQSLLASALSVESRNGKEQSTGLNVFAACLRCEQRLFHVRYSDVHSALSPAVLSLNCPTWNVWYAELLVLTLTVSAGLLGCFETGKTLEVKCSNSARASSL